MFEVMFKSSDIGRKYTKSMLKDKFDINIISKYTGLSLDEIKAMMNQDNEFMEDYREDAKD